MTIQQYKPTGLLLIKCNIHPSIHSAAYPGSGHGGSGLSREVQNSLTLSSSSDQRSPTNRTCPKQRAKDAKEPSCLNHLNWRYSMWWSSTSTISPSQMICKGEPSHPLNQTNFHHLHLRPHSRTFNN